MYRHRSRKPAWTPVLGADFLFAPIDKPMLRAARLAASTVDHAAADSPLALEEAGDALSRALIVAGLRDWRGIIDDETEKTIAFSPGARDEMLEDPIFFDALDEAYVLPYYARVREKNASSPSQNGTGGAKTPVSDIAPTADPMAVAPPAPTPPTPRKPKRAPASGKH